MKYYKGSWSFAPIIMCTTHTVKANNEDEAVDKLIKWAYAHKSVVDEPCDFEIEELKSYTFEELMSKCVDSIMYAFNAGDGYYDIIIADKETQYVYEAYTLTNERMWVENDEFGAKGKTITECIRNLCFSFPTWKLIYKPQVTLPRWRSLTLQEWKMITLPDEEVR